MRDDHIRKLLGGYATNTLTETERRALFEAALDDQQLFDALQDEQALRQLLADPASRQVIQRALDSPAREKPLAAWWTRRWLWAGAASAVAAAALILVVVQQNRPEATSSRIEIASTQQPADLEREIPPEKKPAEEKQAVPLNSRRLEAPRLKTFARDNLASRESDQNAPSPIAAPPPAAPAAPAPPVLTSGSLAAEAQSQTVGGVVGGGLAAPKVNGFLEKTAEPLRYTLLRKDAQGLYTLVPSDTELRPGDSVRLNVSPAMSGYIALDQLLPSGEWKRVFPESPPGRLLAANTDITVPDSAIEVQNTAQKFRIAFTPGQAGRQARFEIQALRATGARDEKSSAGARDAKDAAVAQAKQIAPLTIEVTIAPGKLP